MTRTSATHITPLDKLAALLATSIEQGLDSAEAERRRRLHGPNLIESHEPSRWRRVLLDQLTDLMTVLLVAAGGLAAWIGEPQDAAAIGAILTLNISLGVAQSYQAERALARLRTMAAPTARVRRNGAVHTVPAAELVPGDVVFLEAGLRVPADLRLVEAPGLLVDESILTGESQPVTKSTETLDTVDLPLGDRTNLTYAGTTIAAGRGVGLVVTTGTETELGRIASLLHKTDETLTPLQRRLAVLGRRLALVALAICAIVFATGLLAGEPLRMVALTAVGLAIAAIPEALPTVVTVALAMGTRRMSRVHALVRHLAAVETLGSVTVICADKTGTLTENRMRATRLWSRGVDLDQAARPGEQDITLFWQALALCNDVSGSAAEGWHGDPTEIALVEAAENHGFAKASVGRSLPRIDEVPFSSERGMMSTTHRDGAEALVFAKGAPEAVIAQCDRMWSTTGERPLDPELVTRVADTFATEGHRVLAFSYHREPSATGLSRSRSDCLIGLVGLSDPPRSEAAEAVALCRSAGITPVMITGDHPRTARAVARKVGIIDDDAEVLTGAELDRLDPAALADAAARVRVYARVTPAQKLSIVTALQARGQIVAMTGDGVNDAPAIKRADVGIAMGRRGTDVAREAADLVLVDDNFATIVKAVREGRRIIENVRKFIRYVMTANTGEIATLLLAPVAGLPIPLLPVQILWINLVTDGLPGLALTAEPEEPSAMQTPPRSPEASPFAGPHLTRILGFGLLLGGLSLTAAAIGYRSGSAHWRTMTFTVLTLGQLFLILGVRSTESLRPRGLWANLPLLLVLVGTAGLHVLTIQLPWLNRLLSVTPLTAYEWAVSLGLASLVLAAVEIEKVFRKVSRAVVAV